MRVAKSNDDILFISSSVGATSKSEFSNCMDGLVVSALLIANYSVRSGQF